MLEALVVVIAFLGLIFGGMLAVISPEEMKKGEKWFRALRGIVLSALFIAFAFLVLPNFLVLLIGGLIGFAIATLFSKIYFYLGIGLMVSFLTFINDYIVLIASLIFIFGLPEGTLRVGRLKNKNWTTLKRLSFNSIFFIVPFLFLFSKDFIILNIDWVLAFVAGGIICLTGKKTYSEVFLKI